MTRPLTCICVLLAGASGLYLYQSKHQAQMLDREIAHTLKAADVARDRIGVLRGEWALLNEPERLAALSQAHLGLKTLAPTQFATAAELAARLPPPVLPGTVTILADDAFSPPTVETLSQPAPPVAAPVTPAPARANVVVAKQPTAVPNQLAAALPPTPPRFVARTSEARVSEARAAERHEDPTPPRPPIQVASALPMPTAPLPMPRPAAMHPVLAPVVNVSASQMAAPLPRMVQARPAPARSGPSTPSAATTPPRSVLSAPENPTVSAALAPPSYVRPSYNSTSTSALGGSRPLLPPPVPFGSAMAPSYTNAR